MSLLEGGCGDGRYVRYFTDLGIRTIGVDFAQTTVRKINELLPDLEVKIGDIRRLNFPDGYFDGYYSGGVIEHFEDGITPQLAEAQRVLKDGGYFFVTVPHMNLSRMFAGALFRTRKKLDLDGRKSYHKDHVREFIIEEPPVGFHFHEYVFFSHEMRRFLKDFGFSIVEEMCFSSTHGLCDIELYRRLIGADRARRTVINKFFAIPLKCTRSVEDNKSVLGRIFSDKLGVVFGNLKLYVCKAVK